MGQESPFSSVTQSCPTLCDPWTAAGQASLSITNSRSLLKLMSIKLAMPSNHLILCRPLIFLPSIFPSIRVFSSSHVWMWESEYIEGWVPNWWTWVWASSGSWWLIGKPGLLQFMGRKESDKTEWLNWRDFLGPSSSQSPLQYHKIYQGVTFNKLYNIPWISKYKFMSTDYFSIL